MRKTHALSLSGLLALVGFVICCAFTVSASTADSAAAALPAHAPGISPLTANITATPTVTGNVKIAGAIAVRFSVPVTEVLNLHQGAWGWGFGDIYKLYQMAEQAKVPTATLMAMRLAGQGWGEIARSLNLHPGNRGDNLGGAVSGRIAPTGTVTATATGSLSVNEERGRGRGAGQGARDPKLDKPGRGSQDDHGRGNSNGNGKGNPGSGNPNKPGRKP